MARSRSVVIFLLALALGACTADALTPRRTVTIEQPLNMPIPTPQVIPDEKGDGFEMPVFSNPPRPIWPSVRSDVGGLPIPRGWKLVERNAKGYNLSETYESPTGIDYDHVLAWYLTWFPSEGSWGDWVRCWPAGSGDGGWYEEPEYWAWQNPRNEAHSIEIGLSGSPLGGRTRVSLRRSGNGDCAGDGV